MMYVSFAMTVEAFRDRSKTETRRFWKESHAKKFRPGTVFVGTTKSLRNGGRPMHAARVVAIWKERLGDISDESFEREGGTRYWQDKAEYIRMMGGPDRVCYVVRFEHL